MIDISPYLVFLLWGLFRDVARDAAYGVAKEVVRDVTSRGILAVTESDQVVDFLLSQTEYIQTDLQQLRLQDLNTAMSAFREALGNHLQSPPNLKRAHALYSTAVEYCRSAASQMDTADNLLHLTRLRMAAYAAHAQIGHHLVPGEKLMQIESMRTGMQIAWDEAVSSPVFTKLQSAEFDGRRFAQLVDSFLSGDRQIRQRQLMVFRSVGEGVNTWLKRQGAPPLALENRGGMLYHDILALTWKGESKRLVSHTYSVEALAISGDLLFSGSEDDTIRVWDAQACDCDTHSPKLVTTLRSHTNSVRALATKGDLLFSGSTDDSIRVWDVHSHRHVATLGGHKDSVNALAVHGDLLFSGSADDTIRVWNVSGDLNGSLEHMSELADNTRPAALVMKGDMLFSVSGNEIRVWNISGNGYKHVKTLTGHTGRVLALAVNGDLLFSGALDSTIRVWNVQSHEYVTALRGHTSSVNALALNDNLLFSGSADNSIRVWDVAFSASSSYKQVTTLVGHSGSVNALAVNGNLLFSGAADATIRVWGHCSPMGDAPVLAPHNLEL